MFFSPYFEMILEQIELYTIFDFLFAFVEIELKYCRKIILFHFAVATCLYVSMLHGPFA